MPPELVALDWRRHTEIMGIGYDHTKSAIEIRKRQANGLHTAVDVVPAGH